MSLTLSDLVIRMDVIREPYCKGSYFPYPRACAKDSASPTLSPLADFLDDALKRSTPKTIF